MGLSRELSTKLAALLEGELDSSQLTCALYSTDASMYKIMPHAVAFPKHVKDVILLTEFCNKHKLPLIPRGGGSGLAGQAIGEGIIVDFKRHMNTIIKIDKKNKTVTLEPGINLDVANEQLKTAGFKIGPDPASSAMCTLGGMVGTNAKGARSIKYGKVSDNIVSLDVVLADGTPITFEPLSKKSLKEKCERTGFEGDIYRKVYEITSQFKKDIAQRFPKIDNNSCGYNLKDITRYDFDLTQLICGSEGTLATVVGITLDLVPIPKSRGGVLLFFKSLEDAMSATQSILKKKPDAVELIDDELIALAKNHESYSQIVESYPKTVKAALLVEVSGSTTSQVKTKINACIKSAKKKFSHRIAHDSSELASLWKLRKSGEPILMSRTDDFKHFPFVEDSCVDPKYLLQYIAGFKKVMKKHNATAAYYGHASRGLLHIRPLVNIKTAQGIEKMQAIAQDITDLIISLDGTISGEHGDGLVRTQFIRQQYGEGIFSLFREIKAVFDPNNILNPGKIVGDVSMSDNLRYGINYKPNIPQSNLSFSDHTDFQHAAELCHGCSTCSKTTKGIMCPTYMADPQEFLSTRGRANAIARAFSQDLPPEFLTSKEFKAQILDYCIGCKGCVKDCPSSVDMARLKSELLNQYQKKNGRPLLYRIVGNIRTLSSLAHKVPGGRWLMGSTVTKKVLEWIGFDPRRSPPVVDSERFDSLFTTINNPKSSHKVVLFADCFTNFYESKVARTTVEVLQKVGCHVELAQTGCCGRVKLSTGDISGARKNAQAMVHALSTYVEKGFDVVSCESSCITMLQSDYKDLLPEKQYTALADHSFEVMEYLAHLKEKGINFEFSKKKQTISYHGHCHSKAQGTTHHAAEILNSIPGTTCTELDSTCCGMAGFFGYTHYDMSQKIGTFLKNKIDDVQGDCVAATGYSCRCQLKDFDTTAKHPIEYVNEVLK